MKENHKCSQDCFPLGRQSKTNKECLEYQMNRLESLARKVVVEEEQYAEFVKDKWGRSWSDLRGIADPYDRPDETITLTIRARDMAIIDQEIVSRAYAAIRLCKRFPNRCVTFYINTLLDRGEWLSQYINDDARFDHDHELICCKKGKELWKKKFRKSELKNEKSK